MGHEDRNDGIMKCKVISDQRSVIRGALFLLGRQSLRRKGGFGFLLVQIQDDMMELERLRLLRKLLVDKTTKGHILWGTDAYQDRGEAYGKGREMQVPLFLYENMGVITARARKAMEQQSNRTRQHGEVFTPRWVCDEMIDAIDADFFGLEKLPADAWQELLTLFEETKKSWKKYVDNKRLEITCGEGPYLTERYDVSTGEMIPLPERRGIVDRKLLVISHFAKDRDEWIYWALRAAEASYGYEFQGDNLLIARVNMMKTFAEHYAHRWEEAPPLSLLRRLVNKVVWNLWQMDGLTQRLPCCTEDQEGENLFAYADMDISSILAENQPHTQVYFWRKKKHIPFGQMKERDGNMKFDYIIGNPPYQEDTNGAGRQAKPIYNLFFNELKEMQPKCMCLITPSRWFAGGMGLDKFRESMMNDSHLKTIVDFTNAKDCFPNISISGGVNYFVWKKSYNGMCSFTNTTNGETTTRVRPLNEFPVLVRYNHAVDIIHKAIDGAENNLAVIASGLMPFGLSTSYRGEKEKSKDKPLTLYASNGTTYISESEINKGLEYLDTFGVMVSKTGAEHAGEPSKDGKFRVIPSSMRVKEPNEVCTHSYFLIGSYKDKATAENLLKYMKTQFVRFLILMSMSGFGLSKLVLNFVPMQDCTSSSDIDWSKSISEVNQQLYKKYGLSQEEVDFIEKNVKEMK